jgi:hypothetical protein
MTAPYVTDGAAVVKRRLRSEYPDGFLVSPFTVGCGYAAHYIDLGDGKRVGARIVRLADGTSWTLVTPLTGPVFQDALAVTCTELFARVAIGAETQVARIRLDSLPPGEPAD